MNKVMKAMAAMMLLTVMCFVAGCNKPENKDDDVRVTTYTPQDVTQTSAVCGGDVIVTQGLSLSELGVCWSTSSNPTAEDSHLSTSNWSELYVCSITGLEPGTKYHVRAYALRGLECYYGDDKSFTTEEIGVGGSGIYNGYEYVDLGLPSGTLWATCNVGADIPEDYGDYFAWGETETKAVYDWSTYKYSNGLYGGSCQLTKYCNNPFHGYNGYTDTLTVLQPTDDAATANWGLGWRTPTVEEWRELEQNTTNTFALQNGVEGRLFTATNGNSLFLPAPDLLGRSCHDVAETYGGVYWSSSLNTIGHPYDAWLMAVFSSSQQCHLDMFGGRYKNYLVRAVHFEPQK